MSKDKTQIPSKQLVKSFLKNLGYSLFPYIDGGKEVIVSERRLRKQLIKLIHPISDKLQSNRKDLAKQFVEAIPDIKLQLNADATSIATNDPAATSTKEVIVTYPGFYAIMVYRLANKLHQLNIPLVPRMMTEQAHSLTGIDIHPGATIGNEFFIDHGTGIVIGETSKIGNRVKLYQGVTIGALSVCKESAKTKRHPTIEDDVVIYAGATILSGRTTIGHNSIIGGNVWLTKSVPPYSLVQHEDKVRVKQKRYSLNLGEDVTSAGSVTKDGKREERG
ncbi:MAG: serine O-acetyltransferase EpsC [Bacteroidales bacterium]